jgi:hypothetical protein
VKLPLATTWLDAFRDALTRMARGTAAERLAAAADAIRFALYAYQASGVCVDVDLRTTWHHDGEVEA